MNLTPTQKKNEERISNVDGFIFHTLDTSRYEMAERNQPIYGNPAYKEAKRMMAYEWDYMRANCVELYISNLKKCIAIMERCGLSSTVTSLESALRALKEA